MSRLDEQLEILMAKRKKVEAYKTILALISNHTGADLKEVSIIVSEFIERQIDNIENGEVIVPTPTPTSGVSVVREEITEINTADKNLQNKPSKEAIADKIRFAQNNRYLGGRTATVKVGDQTLSGKITGIDAPFILVSTTKGTISVELIELLEQNPELKKE